MKPIKNVLTACEGSEKQYSVNGSESTQMLVGQKQDEAGSLGTTLQLSKIIILNSFNFVPKTHRS